MVGTLGPWLLLPLHGMGTNGWNKLFGRASTWYTLHSRTIPTPTFERGYDSICSRKCLSYFFNSCLCGPASSTHSIYDPEGKMFWLKARELSIEGKNFPISFLSKLKDYPSFLLQELLWTFTFPSWTKSNSLHTRAQMRNSCACFTRSNDFIYLL